MKIFSLPNRHSTAILLPRASFPLELCPFSLLKGGRKYSTADTYLNILEILGAASNHNKRGKIWKEKFL